jgi:hypothetical protein
MADPLLVVLYLILQIALLVLAPWGCGVVILFIASYPLVRATTATTTTTKTC